jgi:hypothetical protein
MLMHEIKSYIQFYIPFTIDTTQLQLGYTYFMFTYRLISPIIVDLEIKISGDLGVERRILLKRVENK